MGLMLIVLIVRRRSTDFARFASILWRKRETMSSDEYRAKCLLWSILICVAIPVACSLSGLRHAGEADKHLVWYDDAALAAVGGLCWGLPIGLIVALVGQALRRRRS